MEVAAARVDVLRPLPESHRGHLGIGAETLLELADRRAHGGRVDASCAAGVPDDRRRGEGALADGVRDHVQTLDAFEVLRDPLVRARPDLQPQHRQREEEQKRRRRGGHRPRVPHDSAREAPPEVELRVPALEDALRHDAHPVEPVHAEVDEHRQERERAGDGDERDHEPADPEAAHEGERHEEHQREADPDRRAAEDDRAPRSLHRADDGVLLRFPGPELLAVAVDDQERVVDRNAEPDEHDEVLQVRRQLHHVREEPDDRERRRDRGRSEDERQQEGERPEDEGEDQRRDRDGDEELADLKVVREDRVEVVLDGGLPGDVDRRAGNLAGGGAHVVRVAFRVGRLQVGDDGGADHGVGDRLDAGELAGRELLCGRRGALADDGQELLRRSGRSLHDDGERADRLLPEVVLEDRVRAGGVGPGEREAVREEVAEPGGGVPTQEE